jgi:hypothetical protein
MLRHDATLLKHESNVLRSLGQLLSEFLRKIYYLSCRKEKGVVTVPAMFIRDIHGWRNNFRTPHDSRFQSNVLIQLILYISRRGWEHVGN